MDEKTSGKFLERLSRSRIYKDYERAFGEATGLPLTLRPVESWQPAQRNKRRENPFCVLMAGHSRSCAACLEVQEEISQVKDQASKTAICFAGLCESAVPVRLGNGLIGFLQTGQVRTKKPTQKQFKGVTRQLFDWGLKVDLKQLEEAYFHTPILTPKQYDSMVRLLTIFGQHLSLVSNQLIVQQQNAEPPTITRA